VKKGAADASQGQGQGVEGEGYVGVPLAPGKGGEEVLREWLGWTRGKEYEVKDGGVVVKEKAKL